VGGYEVRRGKRSQTPAKRTDSKAVFYLNKPDPVYVACLQRSSHGWHQKNQHFKHPDGEECVLGISQEGIVKRCLEHSVAEADELV